ncbi:hypothetical protein GJAV_G00021830 [Gymnothorax javanicus]|nr:hypothetical protein GJAV_G00021830 [Gymnothorax javanicus]
MPVRCEYIMSSCRPVPYREPRKPPSTSHPAWRFSTMHLKPYPKFQKKELKLESNADGVRGLHAGQQGALRAERPARRPRSPEVVPGKGSDGRQPLSILSTNTLCKGPAPAPKVGGDWRRKGTSHPVPLLLLSSEPEQEGSLTLYQGDGADGQLDIWAVIKPGNTKEKIAIFTGQQCGQSSAPANLSTEGSRADVGPANPRTVSMKAKGCWEVEGSTAKRRKRSAEPDKRCCPERLSQGGGGAQREAEEGEGEGEGKTLSVVEMVAFMEQRANKPQVDCTKPLHPRTSGPATAPRVGSLPPAPCPEERPERPEALEGREEEGESVRVLDMVAKLESECLKRQSEREGSGGGLSRNNSLRRSVCRVLLAGPGSEVGLGSAPPQPEPIARESRAVEQYHESMPPPSAETRDAHREETEGSESAAKPCMQVDAKEQDEEASRGGSSRAEHREEPLPGMLFFSSQQEQQSASAASQDGRPRYDREEDPGSKQDVEEREEEVVSEQEASAGSPERVPFPLRKLVSHRFLEMRFKIQLLLEPQQYMALLPHHIIVKIFSLLPTQTLAALKCTCHYFKFIIESYGVRPADSRWVCDPRYRDDPCKQCKRRYGRGDVSLCRWHHKPYCQALPFGPGYWMCCHGLHKDTPGCNVGLHDNRWVPAFHSINMPIYKKARESEEDS